jgi:hypothetical protein
MPWYDAVVKVLRDEWHCGKAAAESNAYLYNSDTKKFDIMGIILFQCLGIDKRYLSKARVPSVVAHKVLKAKKPFNPPFDWLVNPSHTDTEDSFSLIKLNDDPELKDEEREEKIKAFLKNRRIEASFEGTYETTIGKMGSTETAVI